MYLLLCTSDRLTQNGQIVHSHTSQYLTYSKAAAIQRRDEYLGNSYWTTEIKKTLQLLLPILPNEDVIFVIHWGNWRRTYAIIEFGEDGEYEAEFEDPDCPQHLDDDGVTLNLYFPEKPSLNCVLKAGFTPEDEQAFLDKFAK